MHPKSGCILLSRGLGAPQRCLYPPSGGASCTLKLPASPPPDDHCTPEAPVPGCSVAASTSPKMPGAPQKNLHPSSRCPVHPCRACTLLLGCLVHPKKSLHSPQAASCTLKVPVPPSQGALALPVPPKDAQCTPKLPTPPQGALRTPKLLTVLPWGALEVPAASEDAHSPPGSLVHPKNACTPPHSACPVHPEGAHCHPHPGCPIGARCTPKPPAPPAMECGDPKGVRDPLKCLGHPKGAHSPQKLPNAPPRFPSAQPKMPSAPPELPSAPPTLCSAPQRCPVTPKELASPPPQVLKAHSTQMPPRGCRGGTSPLPGTPPHTQDPQLCLPALGALLRGFEGGPVALWGLNGLKKIKFHPSATPAPHSGGN